MSKSRRTTGSSSSVATQVSLQPALPPDVTRTFLTCHVNIFRPAQIQKIGIQKIIGILQCVRVLAPFVNHLLQFKHENQFAREAQPKEAVDSFDSYVHCSV